MNCTMFTNIKKVIMRIAAKNTLLLFVVFLYLISTSSTVFAAEVTPDNIINAVKKVDEMIQNHVANQVIPGCAVAVVYKNEVVFINTYGVRTVGQPEKIDLDTVFQLGSVSKPISSTLASVLEQKGLLNIDDPVSEYLPHFALKGVNNGDTVKVKNILSHTTGVPRHGFNHLIETFEPYTKIVHALQTTKVISRVGRKYDYHNAMFSLIGDITQTITKKSFPDALEALLLKPLKMKNTSATLEALLSNENRASPHIRKKKGLAPALPYSSGYYAVAPAGGINSSINDMAIFLKAQMGGFPQVVSAQALARIQAPFVPTKPKIHSSSSEAKPKNSSYGLGWRILEFADQKFVYHGGWVKGFTNFIGFMPEQQLGIVVLHNGDTKFSSGAAVKFFELAMGLKEDLVKKSDGKKKGKKKGKGRKKKSQ